LFFSQIAHLLREDAILNFYIKKVGADKFATAAELNVESNNGDKQIDLQPAGNVSLIFLVLNTWMSFSFLWCLF